MGRKVRVDVSFILDVEFIFFKLIIDCVLCFESLVACVELRIASVEEEKVILLFFLFLVLSLEFIYKNN